MAIDPTKAKRDIDFDTYVAPREGSTINWAEHAKTITDAFAAVRDDRQKRKDEIDKDTAENLKKLNELDALDNKTLMDMTIDGANNAANAIYEAEQRMKRGEIRPQDFQKIKNNISSGFTQFEKNAKSWDTDFKRYTERMQGGESSSLEQYLGERMESFGNLSNLQLVTNPDTGNLAFGRIDENGNLLTGPDDLISINRMTAISKQEINKVNVGDWITQSSNELGDYITAGNATTQGKDGSSRAVVTIDDFMQTPEAEDYINLKADAAMKDNMSIGSIIADNNITNDKGEKFRAGSQEEFDQWNQDNKGREEQNPIIVMGYKENGVIVEPAITEGQKKAAKKFLVDSLKAKLGREETMKEFPPQQRSAASIAKGDKDKTLLSRGKNLMLAVSGDADESAAGLRYLVDASNGAISDIEQTETGFIVTYPGRDPLEINTEDKSPEESMRLLWKASGLSDAEFDAWLDAGGSKELQGRETTRNIQTISGPKKSIEYDTQALVTDKDGNEVTIADWARQSDLGPNISWPQETNDQVVRVFSELLKQENFYPKGLGMGSVSMDGNTMTFSIGKNKYKLKDVFDKKSAEVATWMQESILKAIEDQKNKGGDETGAGFNTKTDE
tara:strand:+ start:2656 stop:4506 length:1851 start_codon:yes stop_codon:yes gene_type:complete